MNGQNTCLNLPFIQLQHQRFSKGNMPEFKELVKIHPGPHNDETCPFCPLEKEKQTKKSHIGKHNKSRKLASNLNKSKDKKINHLYQDSEHGLYSAEAHHAICGNEVLAEEGEIEKFLVHEGETTTHDAPGYLKPNDVGYDINGHRNGIWLPSVPYKFKPGKKFAGTLWSDLSESDKTKIASKVMKRMRRQFHKGPHEHVGDQHDNYVTMALSRLRQITTFVTHYSEICPMENDQPKEAPPYYPPYQIISIINALSRSLKKEVKGHPKKWKYFISTYALNCSNAEKRSVSQLSK